MNKPRYHVIVWGVSDSGEFGDGELGLDTPESYHDIGTGVMLVFRHKSSLSKWLSWHQARPHDAEDLAGQCFVQLSDGRPCMVIHGHTKALKRQVSII